MSNNNTVMFTYATHLYARPDRPGRPGKPIVQNNYIHKAKSLQNKINRTNSLKNLGFSITLNKMGNMYQPILHVPKKLLNNRGQMSLQLARNLGSIRTAERAAWGFFNFKPLKNTNRDNVQRNKLMKAAQKLKTNRTKAMLLKNGTFTSLPKNIQQTIFKKVIMPNRINIT
jgi:hypothetical protein